MAISKKVLKRTFAAIVAIVVVIYALIGIGFRVMEQSFAGADIQEQFTGNTQPDHIHYEVNGRPMHYVAVGADSLPTILFVHGSPGSWDAFSSFMTDSTLYRQAHLLSVDRPGFGQSNPGKAEPSIRQQAEALVPILEKHKGNMPLILVGHSYGGPVIARLALDHPELVNGLILVGAPIDPEIEKRKWYNYAVKFPLVSFILPKSLRTSNNEMWMLNRELEALLPLWEKLEIPVTLIQGGKDILVKPKNVQFAQKVMVNAKLDVQYLPEVNHFIPWSHPEIMTDAIVQQLNTLRAY